MKYAPAGKHFGFEPIPALFQKLQKRYGDKANCNLFEIALSDKKGSSTFNYVISNPSYSGIRKRKYDRRHEEDTQIEVKTDLLDNIIPNHLRIDFIKIDVEGGEMAVLQGGEQLLRTWQPLIVFECGLGGSDIYGTTPEKIFSFLSGLDYRISLLDDYYYKRNSLTLDEFSIQFHQNKNYYFIAHS